MDKIVKMTERSVPEYHVPEYPKKKEGVQKVFGTLDLFVSLLETEIKYPILQGGILPFWTPSFAKKQINLFQIFIVYWLNIFHIPYRAICFAWIKF